MAHPVGPRHPQRGVVPSPVLLHPPAAALSCHHHHHHHHHEDPHVQPGDQDAHVPVPGVANVVLRVELVAVGAEGVEQLVPVTVVTLELLRPLDF